jgi:predicted P-loop ATPase
VPLRGFQAVPEGLRSCTEGDHGAILAEDRDCTSFHCAYDSVYGARHVIEIVRSHIREGIRPVPIPFRKKGPRIPNWESLVITEANVDQFFNGSPMNVGAILGAPSGNLQDVDLDCAEALRLAPWFLPETRTFGRNTNPSSHYLFRAHDLAGEGTKGFDDPIAKLLGRKSKLVELRSNGGQTVLPGSTHKDTGELITWDNPATPIASQSRAFLETRVAELAAGCMILRYWRPLAADIFVSTLRAAEWSNERIWNFLNPIASVSGSVVNLEVPSIDPAAWREALALPRCPERAEEKEKKEWAKVHANFISKMLAWLGFPTPPPPPRPIRSPERRAPTSRFARASAYVAAMPEAISGSGGHLATFNVARKIVQDFELNDSEVWTILLEHNARCKPPWSEKELQHKLESARKAHTANLIEDRPPPELAHRTCVTNEPEPEPEANVVITNAEQGQPPPPPQNKNERNWRRHLITKKVKDPITGQPKDVVQSTQPNVCTILTFHPDWVGVLVYDSFSECVVKTREPPWPEFERCVRTEPQESNPRRSTANEWSELDSKKLVNWLAREENINVTEKIAMAAAEVTANAFERHPVRDYLRSLVWDGIPRLDEMLGKYFGAGSTLYRDLYTRGVSVRWMISAVARVMRPGCQADCALILESKKQGRGKSTGLEILASAPWFADSGIDIGNKDSYQNLRGVWIYELGELDGVRGREVTKVKNYIGARSDRYRRTYGSKNADVPRQGVFAGTTNEAEYLQDTTGNRRFWPVRVHRDVDREALRRDRDQLWAEAYARYLKGEAWHINTKEFRKLCEEQQQDRVRDDVWAPKIATWLQNPTILVPGVGSSPGTIKTIDVANNGVLTHEVLEGALGKPTGDATRGDEMRVAAILRSWGYEPGSRESENGERVRRYKKVEDEPEPEDDDRVANEPESK